MKNYNSKTITLKINSAQAYSETKQKIVYSKKFTQLKADALTALLISSNPLRKTYNFTGADYDYIKEQEEILFNAYTNVMARLDSIKKDA